MDRFDFKTFVEKKMAHSYATWPEQSLKGVLAHARKECDEIEQEINNPDGLVDASEWVDLLLLSIDGAIRSGLSSSDLIRELERKHQINTLRKWPKPASPDHPGEHERS